MGPTQTILGPVVLATGASAVLAWLQIRRHQELAQSYAVASHELALAESRARHVRSEEELARFVGDAEAAISREHTLWIARRDESATIPVTT